MMFKCDLKKSTQNQNVSLKRSNDECWFFLSLLRISLYYNYCTTNTSATLNQFCFSHWVVTVNIFFIIEWLHGTQTHPTIAAPWQQSGLQLISEYFSTKGRLQVCMPLIIDLLRAATWSMFGQCFPSGGENKTKERVNRGVQSIHKF